MCRRLNVDKGDKYGRLSIVSEADKRNGRRHFVCLCECGNEAVVDLSKLRNGRTRSCGCLASEVRRERNTTHGKHKHPLYNVWNSMKQRCTNPEVHSYHRYGGRGIDVCNEWLKFEAFYEWSINNGFKEGLTLDRINNDGSYEPGNCKWSSKLEQANNRISNRFVTYKNETKTLSEWRRSKGIKPEVLWKRINRGWSVEKTLTTPLQTSEDK